MQWQKGLEAHSPVFQSNTHTLSFPSPHMYNILFLYSCVCADDMYMAMCGLLICMWAYMSAGVDVQRPKVDSERLPQPLFTSLRQSLLLNPELTIQLPLESHLALGISYLPFPSARITGKLPCASKLLCECRDLNTAFMLKQQPLYLPSHLLPNL